jgi:hypothetical protein
VGGISREKHESYEMRIHYLDHGNRDPQQGGDSISQERSDFRLVATDVINKTTPPGLRHFTRDYTIVYVISDHANMAAASSVQPGTALAAIERLLFAQDCNCAQER